MLKMRKTFKQENPYIYNTCMKFILLPIKMFLVLQLYVIDKIMLHANESFIMI